MNGEQSDRAYVIEAESDLYLSEDKFILIENQKAYDYELIENTILCLDENEIMGLEVIAYLPDLVVCRDIQTKTSGVGEMSDLIDLFGKTLWRQNKMCGRYYMDEETYLDIQKICI